MGTRTTRASASARSPRGAGTGAPSSTATRSVHAAVSYTHLRAHETVAKKKKN
ncbi:hypothetical protein AERO_18545 [Aeromicrobium fastidiosum]|uniref:hypothetical protein n=1 Tax=Aeromicrobium fastidiosum TaxID=52699 RepID=UPI00202370AD|nr:hypothetical protein [Aeromicrobium fastidiosum]MCL8253383.1 hypothetical protein [Aeromicrobium fastidiosum]